MEALSRLGDTRARDFPGRTRVTERKFATTTAVLTVRNTLGSVRLRSDGPMRACDSVATVMQDHPQQGEDSIAR